MILKLRTTRLGFVWYVAIMTSGRVWPCILQCIVVLVRPQRSLNFHSFSWTKDGIHFDVEKDSKVTMKPRSGTLVIDISGGESTEEYEGVYQCTARNEHGTAVSNNIVVRQSSAFELFVCCLCSFCLIISFVQVSLFIFNFLSVIRVKKSHLPSSKH